MTRDVATIRRLFLQFLRFGCFTFGGGWSIVAQMQAVYVEREGTLTSDDLLDLSSIGRSIPGAMISNIAMFYGFRMAGFWGGVACVFGLVLPPTVVLTLITWSYTAVQEDPWAVAAMRGVRTAVVPIIVGALFSMLRPSGEHSPSPSGGRSPQGANASPHRGAFPYPPCLAVAIVSFALYFFWGVNCVWLVLIGLVCGLAICEFYERRACRDGHESHDPA